MFLPAAVTNQFLLTMSMSIHIIVRKHARGPTNETYNETFSFCLILILQAVLSHFAFQFSVEITLIHSDYFEIALHGSTKFRFYENEKEKSLHEHVQTGGNFVSIEKVAQ